ncbi:hypothetical protein D3C80_1526070 [compost metagenome]
MPIFDTPDSPTSGLTAQNWVPWVAIWLCALVIRAFITTPERSFARLMSSTLPTSSPLKRIGAPTLKPSAVGAQISRMVPLAQADSSLS